jgi:hypothetical protein
MLVETLDSAVVGGHERTCIPPQIPQAPRPCAFALRASRLNSAYCWKRRPTTRTFAQPARDLSPVELPAARKSHVREQAVKAIEHRLRRVSLEEHAPESSPSQFAPIEDGLARMPQQLETRFFFPPRKRLGPIPNRYGLLGRQSSSSGR